MEVVYHGSVYGGNDTAAERDWWRMRMRSNVAASVCYRTTPRTCGRGTYGTVNDITTRRHTIVFPDLDWLYVCGQEINRLFFYLTTEAVSWCLVPNLRFYGLQVETIKWSSEVVHCKRRHIETDLNIKKIRSNQIIVAVYEIVKFVCISK